MVSVIIPVYNAAHYVSETIQSVLASTYADLEVVCIDDGSTDNSLQVLQQLAQTDSRIRVLHQANAGVCRARNAAIAASKGEYILPVDADNLLMPDFISQAVGVLQSQPEVKAVAPTAEFFGERTGLWRLPKFDLKTEAHRNILDTCALYRRSDFDQTDGYCAEIIAREDWDFWINMLKRGGTVVRLPELGLRYRVQKGSKREKDRQLKSHVIRVLNQRHPEFFEKWLGGPLRKQRSWSHVINIIHRIVCPRRVHVEPTYAAARDFVASLPIQFGFEKCGRVIYKGRNELREFTLSDGNQVIVKSFCVPNIVNRIAYGLLRASKAERSCQYAALLRSKGIGSPAPVGWCTVRHGLFFTHSYYASLRSTLPYTYIDLIKGNIPDSAAPDYLRAVGRTAGRLHNAGIIHRDFSRGNILLGRSADGSIAVELVDLNRLRFHSIGMDEGLKNFERLPATPTMRRHLAEGYAAERGYDLEQCLAHWPATEAMDSAEAKAIRVE